VWLDACPEHLRVVGRSWGDLPDLNE